MWMKNSGLWICPPQKFLWILWHIEPIKKILEHVPTEGQGGERHPEDMLS